MMDLKKNAIRRGFILALVILVVGVVIFLNHQTEEKFHPQMYEYYIEHSYEETGAPNMVSAIYISYRVFDTMFEALLLVVAVTAVIYFASPWDIKEKRNE